ncbi:hypothetical protein J4425_02850 [Candidatus Woesearchaeota archaeon]|nr:hypothetical protein [Candidatus Woesearchaeota archaeon]
MIEVINSKGSVSDVSKAVSSGLAYINAYDLDNKDLNLLSKTFGISEYILKDFLDPRELPRFEKEKTHEILIMKCLTNDKVKTLGVIKHSKYIMTVSGEKFDFRAEADYFKDSSFMLKKIVYKIIKDFYDNLEKIEDDVNYVEDITFDMKTDDDPREIFKLKKLLFYRRKALNGNKTVISNMNDLNDISIELSQLVDTENTLTSRLTEIMNMHMTYTSNKLNETMKGFTIIASLILIPTLISGIYGMNVLLPLGNLKGSFYIILGMMVISIIILLTYLKIRKWI